MSGCSSTLCPPSNPIVPNTCQMVTESFCWMRPECLLSFGYLASAPQKCAKFPQVLRQNTQ